MWKEFSGGTGDCGRPVGTLPACALRGHRSPSGATRHLPRIGGVCPVRGGFLCSLRSHTHKNQKAAARTGAAAFSTLLFKTRSYRRRNHHRRGCARWFWGPSAWHPGHAGGRQSRGRARWNAGRRSAGHGRRDCCGSRHARHHGRHGRCGGLGKLAFSQVKRVRGAKGATAK